MKNNILTIIAVLSTTGFLFTGCDKELDRPPIDVVDQNKVLEIKDIYQILADSGNNYIFADDYMLYATVTMNDVSGNIYKEAYIQDTTGGINLYKLTYAESTKVGDYVRINLNGVEIVDYNGKLELKFGDYLDSDKHIVVQESNVPIEPDSVSVADILTGNYKCKLVKVYGVQFKDDELTNPYCIEIPAPNDYEQPTYSMNRYLVSCNGEQLIARTSNYAYFAKDTVPQGSGTMIAIVTLFQYSGGSPNWQLLIRSTDEVDMDDPRCN